MIKPLLILHPFFLWTFSIILLIPCEHQESLPAVLVTHMIQRAVSVGEVKSFQAVGLTQKVVEMLKVKQNTTLALNPCSVDVVRTIFCSVWAKAIFCPSSNMLESEFIV